jgi:hypothetical protein
MGSLNVAYSSGPHRDRYLENWHANWGESAHAETVFNLQWDNQCCGWRNATDRALPVCPDTFESGCQQVADAYMRPRFNEIFVGSLICLVSLVVAIVQLLIDTYCIKMKDEPARVISFIREVL